MPKIAVVIDSTANLPQPLVDQYAIRVLPQTLVWGNETFRDGIDIQPDEFYTRLKTAKALPTTSQVTPGEFQQTFTELLDQDYSVLSIVISEKLSGTMASALQAQQTIKSDRVAVVDSQTTSLALAFLALLAARAAEGGASLAECQTLVEKAREHVGVFFVVDTLKYLHMGGRIGGGARFLGTALDLKPILELNHGQIIAVERVRTKRKAFDRLLEIAGERIKGCHPLHLGILHASAIDDATRMIERSQTLFNPEETLLSEVGPVVGTHAGPGTIGLVYLAGM